MGREHGHLGSDALAMNKSKPEKPEGREVPIEDPHVLQDAMRMLFEAESEFPIKVEGTSTLPYSSQIQSLDFEQGQFVLKLVRPLPHELMEGAIFRMVFAVEEQRFEGLIVFMGREAYLQYRFQLPPHLFHADRRRHKRFPFRPRENAYVIAQDAGLPGLGLAGPLVNISMGGFAMRVDRVLKLDDGLRIPPNTALFERGKGFNRIRIQDLPRLKLMEPRGIVTHATERGTEVLLGLSFNNLSDEEAAALTQSLELRDKMYRGGQPPRPDGSAPPAPRHGGARAEEDFLEPEAAAAEDAPQELTMVLRLQRRTTRVVLVMADGLRREAMADLLRHHGYHRLELLEDLAQLQPLGAADPRRDPPHLILVDLALAQAGDAEPLAAVRIIERQLAEVAELPMAILCEEVDPTLLLAQAPQTRFLPYAATDEARWIGTLDGLLS
jgi:hypothetical protein